MFLAFNFFRIFVLQEKPKNKFVVKHLTMVRIELLFKIILIIFKVNYMNYI